MKRKKLNILVTAGATREPIDPVRFISNRASGFLGCAIAQEAKRRGHRVRLIAGALTAQRPQGIPAINVETARQMQDQLNSNFPWCDCLIMSAAVGDFRAERPATQKIKRGAAKKELTITLRQNPDILAGLGRKKKGRTLVGFSLETEDLGNNARDKLRQKNLDFIVATQLGKNGGPFGKTNFSALLFDRQNNIQKIKTSKAHLAKILLDKIERAA